MSVHSDIMVWVWFIFRGRGFWFIFVGGDGIGCGEGIVYGIGCFFGGTGTGSSRC